MASDQAVSDLASSLSVDETPVKLRCATCSHIAYNALRLPCCEQNICETCYNELEDVCQVCHHEPLDKSLCTPNKSLRTTTKIFLKKKLLERTKELKKSVQDSPAAPTADTGPTQAQQPPSSNTATGDAIHLQEVAERPDVSQPSINPLVNAQNASTSEKDQNQTAVKEAGPPLDERTAQDEGESTALDSHVRDATGLDDGRAQDGNFQTNNMAAGMNGVNQGFPMDMSSMMAMGGMPNMMGMGMDPMMMNAMANSMFGGFGGSNMGMNGMNGMNGMGMGQFNGPWMNGQESFNADAQGNFSGPGGYNMPSYQSNYNQQYSHNEFQNGYGRRGFHPRGRGRGGRFYRGYGRYNQGYMNQGNQHSYNQGYVAGNQTEQQTGQQPYSQTGWSEPNDDSVQQGYHKAADSDAPELTGSGDADENAAFKPEMTHDETVTQKDNNEHSGESAVAPETKTDHVPTHNDSPASADDGKPLPIQSFVSDEPPSRAMDYLGPNVPRGPSSQNSMSRGFRAQPAQMPPAQALTEPKVIGVPGAPTGPRAFRGGFSIAGRAGLATNRRANVVPPSEPRRPSKSPSPPPESRRSRTKSPSESRQAEDQPQINKDRSRSRSIDRDDPEQVETIEVDPDVPPQRRRSNRDEADVEPERDDHESSHRTRRSPDRDADGPRPRRHGERSYDRDHDYSHDHDRDRDRRRHRDRDPEERDRDLDSDRQRRRRRHRSRSRSPVSRSGLPAPSSATAPTFPASDEGSRKRRERDPDGDEAGNYRQHRNRGDDDDRERRERKRSRRDHSASRREHSASRREHSASRKAHSPSRDRSHRYAEPARRHGNSSRDASKTSTPITPSFPPVPRRPSSHAAAAADDGAFRPPTGPSARRVPTGPRAEAARPARPAREDEAATGRRRPSAAAAAAAAGQERPGPLLDKDPHTLEREARDRERLLKEMQRRATLDGGKRDGERRRRGDARYEDENGEDAHRVEREREGARWR